MKDKLPAHPRVLGLFSGCGGLDLGFKNAGFQIVYANDIQESVRQTYDKNLGHPIDICDIRQVDKKSLPAADVILAGIPCQPFSNAGKRESTKTSDGNLFLEVLSVIKAQEVPPSVVLFENVKGFLSSRDDEGVLMTDRFIAELKELGYRTSFKLLNAADFGVPSNRERVFIVCIRDTIKVEFEFPSPDKSKQKVTIGEVLARPMPKGELHEVWKLSPSTMEIIKFIPEGGSWKNVPYDRLSDRHKRIRDDMKKYKSPNFYRRFARQETMGTVTAAATPENSGIIHPLEDRRYSVREIARFQSFPDSFKFVGDSVASKYKMIGNSVPPLLAERVAESILEQVFGVQPKPAK
jgi:DNA (cytosine-5)-methyltransferase 1